MIEPTPQPIEGLFACANAPRVRVIPMAKRKRMVAAPNGSRRGRRRYYAEREPHLATQPWDD